MLRCDHNGMQFSVQSLQCEVIHVYTQSVCMQVPCQPFCCNMHAGSGAVEKTGHRMLHKQRRWHARQCHRLSWMPTAFRSQHTVFDNLSHITEFMVRLTLFVSYSTLASYPKTVRPLQHASARGKIVDSRLCVAMIWPRTVLQIFSACRNIFSASSCSPFEDNRDPPRQNQRQVMSFCGGVLSFQSEAEKMGNQTQLTRTATVTTSAFFRINR